ncbi:MAG: hypothetical protein GY795_26220 [Desulfobacterales bacterium]|nr:hypothetical protein [Desulfobacterales bacterium]
MNRFTNFTVFAVLAMAAILSTFCAPAFADQITIDLPAVDVTVSKDADGYAKFSFSDPERGSVQFISRTGEPAIPYLIVKALLPPGADLATVEVDIKREDVSSEAVQGGDEWEVK